MAKKPAASYNPFTNANRALTQARSGNTGNTGGGVAGSPGLGSPSQIMAGLRAEGKIKRQPGRGRRQMPRGRRKTR